MSTYAVRITQRALGDMEAIYQYIADELLAPENALGQYNRIADAIESLHTFPHRCRLFSTPLERQLGMRILNVDNYSVVFVTDETSVTVLRVLYSRSDLSARLLNDQ